MPSTALQRLDERLEDVQRLLEAHQSGRRWRLDALNRGAIVLLCAQLQGYLADLFDESSRHLLEINPQGQVFRSRSVFVAEVKKSFGNPNPDRVKGLFRFLGISDVFEDLHWDKMTPQEVRRNLKVFVELRNEIAHGLRPEVTRDQVENWMLFVRQFAARIEYSIYDYLRLQTGTLPW